MSFFSFLRLLSVCFLTFYSSLSSTTTTTVTTATTTTTITSTNNKTINRTHFLESETAASADIFIFEAGNDVGGRVKEIEVSGLLVETGGTAIHSLNNYMIGFVEGLGLSMDWGDDDKDSSSSSSSSSSTPSSAPADDGQIGIWSGSEFLFRSAAGSSWLTDAETVAKMALRYGISSPLKLRKLVKETQQRWQNIYEIQKNSTSFDTPLALMKALGLANQTRVDAFEFFESHGIERRLIDEVVVGISRVNYGQAVLNAFADMVSLAGAGVAGGKLGSVREGNSEIPRRLISRSNATLVLNHPISGIKLASSSTPSRPRFVLSTETSLLSSPYTTGQEFDAVVIAAPLESAKLEFDERISFPPDAGIHRPYETTHVTFIEAAGGFSSSFFGGVAGVASMDTIMTTESELSAFSCASSVGSVEGRKSQIYKVFSRAATSDEFMERMFDGIHKNSTTRLVWQAYPQLKPQLMHDSPPFRLSNNIWYVNAFESAVSAMETEVVAARNVALGLSKDLQQQQQQQRFSLE